MAFWPATCNGWPSWWHFDTLALYPIHFFFSMAGEWGNMVIKIYHFMLARIGGMGGGATYEASKSFILAKF